jgi:hypothetical protein
MTWLLVLSGYKGFAMPNIKLDAFIYCILRPQFSRIYTDENHLFAVGTFNKTDAINSLQFLYRSCIVLFLLSHTWKEKNVQQWFYGKVWTESFEDNVFMIFLVWSLWRLFPSQLDFSTVQASLLVTFVNSYRQD